MPYRPEDEYEPRQRGIVAAAKMGRGNRYLRDGDYSGEECPMCWVELRVHRPRVGAIELRCPCGYSRFP
jgi:hypothetical protein